MHVPDGVLSVPVMAGCGALSIAGVAIGLKKLDSDHIPRVAVLSSAFFVISLISFPAGPSSVHLVLSGLCGIILGWQVFPAMFVALIIQAALFGVGGLMSLGANTFNMAFPALVICFIFKKSLKTKKKPLLFFLGFVLSFCAILVSAIMLSIELYASRHDFINLAYSVILMQLPVCVLDGIVTGFAVLFIKRVQPDLLEGNLK